MIAPVDTYVLFTQPEAFEDLEGALYDWSRETGVRVFPRVSASASLGASLNDLRREAGSSPVGVLASTEEEVIDALLGGADEACVLGSRQPGALVPFLARIRVRAHLRVAQEASRNSSPTPARPLDDLGVLVSGLTHELNNPLSTITLGFDILRSTLARDMEMVWALQKNLPKGPISREGLADLLSDLRSEKEDTDGLFEDLAMATSYVTELVRDLRVFARGARAETQELFAPEEVLGRAMRLVRREFGPKTLIELDYTPSLPELCLPKNRVTQILTNLLLCSAQASRDQIRELNRVRVMVRAAADFLLFTIGDPAFDHVPPEEQHDSDLASPATTDSLLTFSECGRAIHELGGSLLVTRHPTLGLRISCSLPLPTDAIVESTRRKRRLYSTIPPPGGVPSVLLVDDDPRVLRSLCRILERDFKILIARNGKEAIDLIASGSRPDVIVTELGLPEVEGPEFCSWLAQNKPALSSRVVFLTGSFDRSEFREFLAKASQPLLRKPPQRDELLQALHGLLVEGRPVQGSEAS